MAAKPFIAARIPEDIDKKLEAHTKTTGESRTQTLINALVAYLGCEIEQPEKGASSDRLSALEKRVEEIERFIKEPIQASLFDNTSVINSDNRGMNNKQEEKVSKAQKANSQTDNKNDNNPVNVQEITIEPNSKSDNETEIISDNRNDNITDNRLPTSLGERLDNREISELTGIKYETVRSRARKALPIKFEGKIFYPSKEGQIIIWRENCLLS